MEISWQRMSVEEFAAFEQAQGEPIIKVGQVWWRKVRSCFYRPLLPFQSYGPEALRAPPKALLGGSQFAVAKSEDANSVLNMMMFQDIEAYSLQSLERRNRKQVKTALKVFVVRRLDDVEAFKKQAYPVYLEFYQRTRYKYKCERRNQLRFSHWADILYQFPKLLVLGAYRGNALEAVSISKLVGDTVIYSTFFCNNPALRLNVTSLMLHLLREAAAGLPEVKQMFVGMYKYRGRAGAEGFYLDKGCKVASQPACLRLNPLAATFLKYCMPIRYGKLLGNLVGSARPDIQSAGTRLADRKESAARTSNSGEPEDVPEGVAESKKV
jgi:hypothetical protein